MIILQLNNEAIDWNLTYTKKNGKDNNMIYGVGKKIVGHSKLKLWTLFWDQSEHQWPLVFICYYMYMNTHNYMPLHVTCTCTILPNYRKLLKQTQVQ